MYLTQHTTVEYTETKRARLTLRQSQNHKIRRVKRDMEFQIIWEKVPDRKIPLGKHTFLSAGQHT